MAFDNTVESLLSQANSSDFAASSADVGYGADGEWPAAGEHLFQVLDLRVSAGTFTRGKTSTNLPCVTIAIQLREAQPVNPDGTARPPITFWGRPIDVLTTQIPGNIDEKMRGFIKRDLARAKGHLSKILNVTSEEIVSLSDALRAADARIRSDKALFVRGLIDIYQPMNEEGKPSGRPFRTEFLQANVSAA